MPYGVTSGTPARAGSRGERLPPPSGFHSIVATFRTRRSKPFVHGSCLFVDSIFLAGAFKEPLVSSIGDSFLTGQAPPAI